VAHFWVDMCTFKRKFKKFKKILKIFKKNRKKIKSKKPRSEDPIEQN